MVMVLVGRPVLGPVMAGALMVMVMVARLGARRVFMFATATAAATERALGRRTWLLGLLPRHGRLGLRVWCSINEIDYLW
jgi:hypothetical protein